MTKKKTKRTFGLIAALAATTLATASWAEEVLKFAHVYEAASPYHQAALRASEAFSKATDGAYKIEVFPASQLGNETAINEALALGAIDIIYTGPSFLAQSYGPISVSEYPFTLRGYDHWKSYVNSDLFSELAQGYKDITGNEIAAMTYYGARHVTSNKPISTPSDMEGLKIRTPNAPSFQMFPKMTGANPTPLAFAEVYLALQQGVVDAQENPLPTIQFKKFYEVQSNINLTGHIINSLATVVSPITVSKLGEDNASRLNEALVEAAAWASDEIVASEGELVGWFREQGVTVNEVDRTPFIAAVAPALIGEDVPWEPSVYERLQALED